MDALPPVTLAFANRNPLRSLGNHKTPLKLVTKDMSSEAPERSDAPQVALPRVAVLQVLLSAEAGFLRRLQRIVETRCAGAVELSALKQNVNNEDVFQIARFFFLLQELNCTTPEAVEALLQSHNQRIQALLDAGETQFGARSVLKRASFDDTQISICVRTIKQTGRPVFSKQEIASLLFEQMRRDRATRTIDRMVEARLLIEESRRDRELQNKLYTSNRSYIMTDGQIEDAVAEYLEKVQTGLITGL
ncbi:MAG: hypothetical protein AB3N11_03050 [Arenibacterium sp.]